MLRLSGSRTSRDREMEMRKDETRWTLRRTKQRKGGRKILAKEAVSIDLGERTEQVGAPQQSGLKETEEHGHKAEMGLRRAMRN